MRCPFVLYGNPMIFDAKGGISTASKRPEIGEVGCLRLRRLPVNADAPDPGIWTGGFHIMYHISRIIYNYMVLYSCLYDFI